MEFESSVWGTISKHLKDNVIRQTTILSTTLLSFIYSLISLFFYVLFIIRFSYYSMSSKKASIFSDLCVIGSENIIWQKTYALNIY